MSAIFALYYSTNVRVWGTAAQNFNVGVSAICEIGGIYILFQRYSGSGKLGGRVRIALDKEWMVEIGGHEAVGGWRARLQCWLGRVTRLRLGMTERDCR